MSPAGTAELPYSALAPCTRRTGGILSQSPRGEGARRGSCRSRTGVRSVSACGAHQPSNPLTTPGRPRSNQAHCTATTGTRWNYRESTLPCIGTPVRAKNRHRSAFRSKYVTTSARATVLAPPDPVRGDSSSTRTASRTASIAPCALAVAALRRQGAAGEPAARRTMLSRCPSNNSTTIAVGAVPFPGAFRSTAASPSSAAAAPSAYCFVVIRERYWRTAGNGRSREAWSAAHYAGASVQVRV